MKVSIQQLKDNPLNSKIYGEEDVTDLQDQIKKSGWIKPLVITPDNVIISGHRRKQCALNLGVKEVDCIVISKKYQWQYDERFLLENEYREKTELQKTKEYEFYKIVEEAKARERQAQANPTGHTLGGNFPQGVRMPPQGVRMPRSRDLAAAKVGSASGQTMDDRVKTVKQIEERPEQEKKVLEKVYNFAPATAKVILDMPEEQQKKVIEKIKDQPTVDVKSAVKKARADQIKEERSLIAAEGAKILGTDRWNIYLGDITSWTTDKKYDFIITDPPYPKEFLPLYETLALRAKEWLKPDGLLIAMCGQSYLDQIYSMMSKHLSYYWTSAYMTPGQPTPLRQRQVNTTWKPILIYSLNESYKGKIFGDVYTSDGNDKDFHKWGQSVSGMFSLISQICLKGQSILDPFCGSGTTGIAALKHGCLFDGIELLEENVNISKSRLGELS